MRILFDILRELWPVAKNFIGNKLLTIILYSIVLSVISIFIYIKSNDVINKSDKLFEKLSKIDSIDKKLNTINDSISLISERQIKDNKEYDEFKADIIKSNEKVTTVLSSHLKQEAVNTIKKQDLEKILEQLEKLNSNNDESMLKKNLTQTDSTILYTNLTLLKTCL